MPDKPSWSDKIPSAMEQLTSIADEYIDRECVETLLDVKRRRAQNIMALVGVKALDGRSVVSRQDFILYLEAQGGSEYRKAEMERRKKFWKRLEEIREDQEKNPRLLVDAPPRERVKQIARRGVESLPVGMISPGRILIECEKLEGAISWLKEIAIALAVDLEGFRERFEDTQKSLGFEQSGETASRRTGGAVASPRSA